MCGKDVPPHTTGLGDRSMADEAKSKQSGPKESSDRLASGLSTLAGKMMEGLQSLMSGAKNMFGNFLGLFGGGKVGGSYII